VLYMGRFIHKPTVVLADDNGAVLTVTSMLLMGEFDVVATVVDGDDAIRVTNALQPDVVILDIAMPGTDGIAAARRLKTLGLDPRIIFLTIQEDSDYVQVALGLGASYVLKPRLHSDLLPAIRESLAGRVFISSPLRNSAVPVVN